MQGLTGQLRYAERAVVGLDLAASLAMARALGVCPVTCANLLPAIEAELVRGINMQIRAQSR